MQHQNRYICIFQTKTGIIEINITKLTTDKRQCPKTDGLALIVTEARIHVKGVCHEFCSDYFNTDGH